MDKLLQLSENPRVTVRRRGAPDPAGTCVIYWMQRAQRGFDNPALDIAVEAGNLLGTPVVAFIALMSFFPGANLRHFTFLVEGFSDIAEALEKRGVAFILRRSPDHKLEQLCEQLKPTLVIGDENPLRDPEFWRKQASQKLRVPYWTVDADVIVPTKLLLKAQYAARIIRPRLNTHLQRFLAPCKNPCARFPWKKPREFVSLPPTFDFLKGWPVNRSAQPVRTVKGGSKEAHRLLHKFVLGKLKNYPTLRNCPETDGTSLLSPYLHFGHIGPLTIAHAVEKAPGPTTAKEAYLDQLITWRELSINFVRFNPNYDNFECADPWAQRTLAEHVRDPRPVVYSERQLENAETHDPLWNAAQIQMVKYGWMHNYVRMYWGKKILEWLRSPAEAFDIAVRLNDKYELDGRDPNGYAGIAWAIVGKFDRAWAERPIFGKIRYMSLGSTGKKFDSKQYIGQMGK